MLKNITKMMLGLFFVTATAASHAANITIDFEADTFGAKPNGFVAAGFPGVSFTDSVGAGLQLAAFGTECGGSNCLAVFDDFDGGGLFIDFASPTDFISLDYGNDQLFGGSPVVDIALTLFSGATQVAQVIQIPNLNDLMDQTISYSGALFDRATVFYRDAAGAPATLIEVVDNITFNDSAVPVPATLALLGLGLGILGLSKRKKT